MQIRSGFVRVWMKEAPLNETPVMFEIGIDRTAQEHKNLSYLKLRSNLSGKGSGGLARVSRLGVLHCE